MLHNQIKVLSPAEIKAGAFDLGDGTFTLDCICRSKVRSIVVSVDEEKGKALGLCPVQTMRPFCYWSLPVQTAHITSGKEATAILLAEGEHYGLELSAAKFCVQYEGLGVKAGEAFLPTRYELEHVARCAGSLLTAMHKIGLHHSDNTFLSSTLNEEFNVWMQSLSYGAVTGWFYQHRTFGLMPMIEITL